jgi:hypothetical protein
MLRQEDFPRLPRLPRLSRTILSFHENPCPRICLSSIALTRGFSRIIFLMGQSILDASHTNFRQTMRQPGKQPVLFPLFPIFRCLRTERKKLDRLDSLMFNLQHD